MSRTVTALFDSRPEAEAARARLVSRVDVASVRFLAKETAADVDDLKLDPKLAASYREALLSGDHLLVAKVARGEKPSAIIDLLEAAPQAGEPAMEAVQSVQVEFEDEVSEPAETPSAQSDEDTPVTETQAAVASAAPPAVAASIAEPAPPSVPCDEPKREAADQSTGSEQREELRIGEPKVARASARLRSITREQPAEEQVALNVEHVELETRPSERRLTEADIEAGGLLKDRMFEVVEMREEPVVAKELIVREEVIVRKARHERTETIRDTVRRTEVEVGELPSS
jgi:hypothetical protein